MLNGAIEGTDFAPEDLEAYAVGTEAARCVARKAAEACDERAWAFWLEVERAVRELLTEATPPGTTQH